MSLNVGTVDDVDDDLSSAIQTKANKETHVLQDLYSADQTKVNQAGLSLVRESLGAVPYVRHDATNCIYERKETFTNTVGVMPDACRKQCDADPECLSYVTLELGPPEWSSKGFCMIGKGKCAEITHPPWYVHYVKQQDQTYRQLFSITMPQDKRMVTIKDDCEKMSDCLNHEGATKTNFRDWIVTTLLPLAATKAKAFYACERGDTLNMFIEFVDQKQGNEFLNIIAWKPCTFFSAVGESASTFAGLDNGGKEWQQDLSEHAFSVAVGCGDCKLIAPVIPTEPVKVCKPE